MQSYIKDQPENHMFIKENGKSEKLGHYQARIQEFQQVARKNQGHSSIGLEMYKEYIAELRLKC